MIVAEDNAIRIERLELGPYGTNAYILVCQNTAESVLVDAPAEAAIILSKLGPTTPRYILLTHTHGDHIGALAELRDKLKIPVAVHADDARPLTASPDVYLKDGDTLAFGKVKLEVRHTPGHTPGSMSFLTGKYLLSGDTIFPGGPGHTGSPENLRQIVRSLTEKIFTLPDDTRVFPGHGEATVLKKEKTEFAAFSSRPHSPGLCGDVLWLSS